MSENVINTINREAYRTDSSVEKYSNYNLYPNEKYLFLKYFREGESVLDLACGAGRTTLRLYEMGYKVKGTDVSDVLIGLAVRRFPQINFEEGDYTKINEKDSSWTNILISHNGIDQVFPEELRVQALQECYRVLRPGGHLIFSSHNLKSLYFSPYYYLRNNRLLWMLGNFTKAFRENAYVRDLGMYLFYGSPDYCIAQAVKEGFSLLEVIGFRGSNNKFFNKYFSPYIHYVFRK